MFKPGHLTDEGANVLAGAIDERVYFIHTVAHGLDDPAAETRDDRSRRLAMLAHRLRRPRFILTHQAGIADNVDGHDCGEFPCFAHGVLQARATSA